jgi:hypothetical protein
MDADWLKQVNLEAYKHEYLGKAVGTGNSVFDNVVLPVIIWAVCVAVSYLTFRFYRKDMLKN